MERYAAGERGLKLVSNTRVVSRVAALHIVGWPRRARRCVLVQIINTIKIHEIRLTRVDGVDGVDDPRVRHPRGLEHRDQVSLLAFI